MKQKVLIDLVSRKRALAIEEDGTRWPITKWLDRDGEECEATEAATAIAGSDELGWTAIDLSEFTGRWS